MGASGLPCAQEPAKRAKMQGGLNLEQYLELLLGSTCDASAFESDDARRAAWRTHATELMTMVDPGSRPWAWWQYDAPEAPLPRESERDYLARHGLLTETELRRLQSAGTQTSQATRKP